MINPTSKRQKDIFERSGQLYDILKETTEIERISLYEAGLIRYFKPEYNIEFANSFPSRRLKLLNRLYQKDISNLVCEICFEELSYNLSSSSVDAKKYHIAMHNLHKKEDRDIFFSVGRPA